LTDPNGAHLGGLQCDSARLTNASGPALYADGLQVDADVYPNHGFAAAASSDNLNGCYKTRLRTLTSDQSRYHLPQRSS
jgi:hypothetical protein